MYQDGKARIEIIYRGKSIGGCPMLLSTIQLIIAKSIVLHKNYMTVIIELKKN
jgi:hypothetical protein